MSSPEMKSAVLETRAVISVAGEDRVAFLQGLVTNDVAVDHAVYAFVLTPHGRFMFDLIIHPCDDRFLIDCEAERKEDLIKTLSIYKLRSKVSIQDVSTEFLVYARWGDGAIGDPRLPQLGERSITKSIPANTATEADYRLHRLALGVGEGSHEFKVGEDLLAEINADQLKGVSWTKGCYMGQELTARMKYRGLAKKQLVPIAGNDLGLGATIVCDGEEIGHVRAAEKNVGLAMVRRAALEKRAEATFTSKGQNVTLYMPNWLAIEA